MAFDNDLSPAAASVVGSVALGMAPPPDMAISAWVDRGKVVLTKRTGTPRPGPFSFEGVEYLREPLDRLHPDDPCSRVTIRGGAQSAKSSVGQMWVCWSIENNPSPFAIGLPSAGEIVKYNEFKLQPLIEDSPDLKHRVRPVSTKSNEGSNTRMKKLYDGSTLLLFNLASPKELQMISAGNIILEEVGNALREVGTRGSPVKQARERQAAYSVVGSKELMVSTPSELGQCEVTSAEAAGDQRRFYGRCQQCGGHFHLEPEGFRPGERGGTPHHFACPPEDGGCGGVLEEADMPAWRAAGVWLPTFTALDADANPAPAEFVAHEDLERWRTRDCEGREPSYYVWQAMCGLISWSKIATTIAEAKTPADQKALQQQTFGRAWDPSVEAMEWEDVHRLREDYDAAIVPARAGVLTGFCDVQGDYLEWGVIGWGPGGEWWVVERDVIAGDTSGDDVWMELDGVTRRVYPHEAGGELPIEAFGVDTGYRTQRVYSFCRGRQGVFAMDGQPGWKLPIIGKPKPVKVIENGKVKGRVKLWPTGTWELKSLLYWSLKLSVDAGYQTPHSGRGHWSKREDEAWAQQITAEGLAEEKDDKSGETKRWWRKMRDRNEWVDIWVGARALAFMLGVGAPAKDGSGERMDWTARAAERTPGSTQSDLFSKTAAKASVPSADDANGARTTRRRKFFH